MATQASSLTFYIAFGVCQEFALEKTLLIIISVSTEIGRHFSIL